MSNRASAVLGTATKTQHQTAERGPMNTNVISATLSATDRDKILSGLDTLLKLMPFLRQLSAEQRRELFRVGDKNAAFIRKAREAAIAHPDVLPRGFDDKEFIKDANLFDALYAVSVAFRQAADGVDDTFAMAGSDAYAGALVVYRALRNNDPNGAFAVALEEMATRFDRKATTPKSGPLPSKDPKDPPK